MAYVFAGGMAFLMAIGFLVLIACLCYYSYYTEQKKKEEFNNSTYHMLTQNERCQVINDKGLFGEYYIFCKLKWYEAYGGKFLFNVYLPKGDEQTTEIDILFLTTKGFFVIESKNFSGYIFGRADDQNWTQTLNRSSKYRFYNPIKQNNTHIKYLKAQLEKDIPIYSIIVFSNKCVLKSVPESKGNTFIIKSSQVSETIKNILINSNDVMTFKEVNEIQKQLSNFSLKNQHEKQEHIDNIKKKLNDSIREKTKENKVDIILNDEKPKDNKVTIILNDEILRKRLEAYRIEKSKINDYPVFYIFRDADMENIIKARPKTIEELTKIIGDIKTKKYGKDIIKIINE